MHRATMAILDGLERAGPDNMTPLEVAEACGFIAAKLINLHTSNKRDLVEDFVDRFYKATVEQAKC